MMTMPWSKTFETIEECITAYFNLGVKYAKILEFLAAYHGVSMTMRQLTYIINKKLHSKRVGTHTSDEDVLHAISMELQGPSRLAGYRAMTDILQKKYSFRISRHKVMQVMRMVSPADVLLRRQHHLKRRQYRSNGPNWGWHIDGYDKLVPWGFCVSGAIDGFSRKIIYLKVGPTNHDPQVICKYYLDAVKEVGGCPQILQTDCGTENVIIAGLQTLFCSEAHSDVYATESHKYSRSTSNQRIECWWSHFRKSRSDWWIKEFRELTDLGQFTMGNVLHKLCLQFCFMEVIHKDFDFVVAIWNSHRIRPNRMAECLPGVPNELFYLPHSFNVNSYKIPVCTSLLDWAYQNCSTTTTTTNNAEFEEYMVYLMDLLDLQKPTDFHSALQLYLRIVPIAEGKCN